MSSSPESGSVLKQDKEKRPGFSAQGASGSFSGLGRAPERNRSPPQRHSVGGPWVWPYRIFSARKTTTGIVTREKMVLRQTISPA
jgi:hypothetical protein